ncbi:hypothetical protein TorRG33x02_083770 [Trema orientale]|uniref:Uncharacterized protein n=1 Tax=Trema orientale TaxID=63057 RepID=A0A2P5FDL2_TREOI|nr:hypothetical protein TorRG33x02_083770 [Trema orientale]
MGEAGTKKSGCLPYGMLLTKVFNHFEIPLHDESLKEVPMPPYDKVAIERMLWHFDAKTSNWCYKGKDLPGEQEKGGAMMMMKVILVVTKRVDLPPLKKLHHLSILKRVSNSRMLEWIHWLKTSMHSRKLKGGKCKNFIPHTKLALTASVLNNKKYGTT